MARLYRSRYRHNGSEGHLVAGRDEIVLPRHTDERTTEEREAAIAEHAERIAKHLTPVKRGRRIGHAYMCSHCDRVASKRSELTGWRRVKLGGRGDGNLIGFTECDLCARLWDGYYGGPKATIVWSY